MNPKKFTLTEHGRLIGYGILIKLNTLYDNNLPLEITIYELIDYSNFLNHVGSEFNNKFKSKNLIIL